MCFSGDRMKPWWYVAYARTRHNRKPNAPYWSNQTALKIKINFEGGLWLKGLAFDTEIFPLVRFVFHRTHAAAFFDWNFRSKTDWNRPLSVARKFNYLLFSRIFSNLLEFAVVLKKSKHKFSKRVFIFSFRQCRQIPMQVNLVNISERQKSIFVLFLQAR